MWCLKNERIPLAKSGQAARAAKREVRVLARGTLQMIPKRAEHTDVEAGIAQFQSHQIRPVDGRSDRHCRLPVRYVLAKRHEGDQCQSPGRQGRLVALGKAVGAARAGGSPVVEATPRGESIVSPRPGA